MAAGKPSGTGQVGKGPQILSYSETDKRHLGKKNL